MGLDVYLTVPGARVQYPPRIFVREGGKNREISREEWDRRCPGRKPAYAPGGETDHVYSDHVTHNLLRMAAEADLAYALWYPEELGITKAKDLAPFLEEGLEKLRARKEILAQFNPDNGWGNYETLLEFVENYLRACEQYPKADVSVWR